MALFASPSAKQIFAAIKSVSAKGTSKGTLVIMKTYIGDILQFGLAVERAKAQGYTIDMIIVGDDASVDSSKGGMVGRRGLAATSLVHKIVSSAATEIYDIKKLKKLGDSIVNNSVTISATLDHCSVPGRDKENFEPIGKNDAEIGLGIHNEPSVKKVNPVPNIDCLITNLLRFLLDKNDKDRYFVPFDAKNDEVILLVNNIGGTSTLEMYIIANCIIEMMFDQYKLKPVRVIIGEFVTSLNAPGFSITLLNISGSSQESAISISEIKKFLDIPTDAPGWKTNSWESNAEQEFSLESPIDETESLVKSELRISREEQSHFVNGLVNRLIKLLEKEPSSTL